MSTENRTTLKGYFEKGDKPTQTQFASLIDSQVNLVESNTGEINLVGNITASGNISASGTIFANNFSSAGGDIGGITFTDHLNLTGDLTASGNISGSATSTASFGRINFAEGDNQIVLSGSATQTASIGHIIASNNSIQFGTTILNKGNVDNLKSGKPITQAEAIGGFTSILRPQAIMSALNNTDYQKWTTEGRVGTVLGGDLIHDIYNSGGNNYIRMGKSDASTSVEITGSLSISGSSTFTNFGNFRNRLTNDTKAFEVSTDPSAKGGFREGMVTPHTGSAPHLHFMLSGSGQTGIGLLNPAHTLHVSASSADFNALQVEGDAVVNGFLGANAVGNPSTLTGNTVVPAGYNVLLYTTNTNPSITIPSLSNYTISVGASIRMVNMDNIGNIPQTFYNA